MAQGHTRTGVTHHLAHVFAFLFFVAVDGAPGAGRFGLAVGAFRQAVFRIAHKFSATGAQATRFVSVVILAIDGSHAHQCDVF